MDPNLDPFNFQQNPQASPAGPQSNVASEWSDALAKPNVRAALLQAGLSLLQPPSFGQTTGGQIGQAIGSAGEALDRQERSQLAQQEADSKATLREARAAAAEARAGAVGAGLDVRRGQLEVAQQKLGIQQLFANMRQDAQDRRTYQQYLGVWGRDVNNFGKTPPSYEDWRKMHGLPPVTQPTGVPGAGDPTKPTQDWQTYFGK